MEVRCTMFLEEAVLMQSIVVDLHIGNFGCSLPAQFYNPIGWYAAQIVVELLPGRCITCIGPRMDS